MRPTTDWQRGLQYFNGCIYVPNSVDGTGAWDPWDPGTGTVTSATVGTAFDTQLKRTVWTNDGTANRQLGPRKINAGDYQFWLGDKRFCGGFYFSAVFRIETWNNDAGRLFVGLTAGANSNCINDTLQNNTMGLFHKSTDGANILNYVNRDNGGTETTAVVADATHSLTVSGNPVLATGNTLLWEMWHFPNAFTPGSVGLTGTTLNWKLSLFDIDNAADSVPKPGNRVKKMNWGTTGFSGGAGAPFTQMFAPQAQMSNAADTTAGRFSMGVANVYVTPWSGEMD